MSEADENLGSGKINPQKPFFLVLAFANCDGTVGVDWDGNIGIQDYDLALLHAKESAEGGGEYVLVQCTPIKLVQQGKVRVTPIKPPRPPRHTR